jgi:3-oxoacyl-[acyl-carrier-protein] synthase III
MAGIAAGELDLIIVATSTPDFIFPSTACLIQGRLGNSKGAAAFDVQAVCSGFAYALGIAEKFIRSGSHRKALVIGAKSFRAFSTGTIAAPASCSATARARWSSRLPKSRGYWRRRCMPTAARMAS